MNVLKIIVADDDNTIRKGLISILEKGSDEYRVVGEARNGQEALNLVDQLVPDILITDIKMPVMEGVELVQRLHAAKSKVLIIVLSGFDDYAYVRETMRLGVVDYLLKPVNKTVLLDLVESAAESIRIKTQQEKRDQFLHEKLNVSMDILKENLLADLIYSKQAEADWQLVQFVRGGCYLLAVLGLNHLAKLEASESGPVSQVLPNFFYRHLLEFLKISHQDSSTMLTRKGNHLALLFSFPENEAQQEPLGKLLLSYKEKLLVQNGLTFTVGFSEPFCQTEEIGCAYDIALSAFEKRFYAQSNIAISDTSDHKSVTDLKSHGEALLGGIINGVELADAILAGQKTEDVFDILERARLDPKSCREYIQWLVGRIAVRQMEFGTRAEAYHKDGLTIAQAVQGLDTFTEIRGFLSLAFHEILTQMALERSLKSRKLIEQAKAYIRGHYRENIKLTMVADHIFLNASYLSDLFKKETGMNFLDFLLEVRIEEAKKLLAMPETKVYKVSEMVGYDDATSFSRAFKKTVGVSPAEYRKLTK